ncbi:MAG: hypothetical protein JNK87_34215 [Bryobacterales bacterium]|nr:hypothetical protein [Bryobacterales bacterium]
MKVLLDECLPIDFRHSFPGHDVHTTEWAGFKGMKNGKLLRAAEDDGYDVFLTADQGFPYQQSTADRRIAVLVLCAVTNKIGDLLPLVPSVERELSTLKQGSVILVR